jgi:hypothetical protein
LTPELGKLLATPGAWEREEIVSIHLPFPFTLIHFQYLLSSALGSSPAIKLRSAPPHSLADTIYKRSSAGPVLNDKMEIYKMARGCLKIRRRRISLKNRETQDEKKFLWI